MLAYKVIPTMRFVAVAISVLTFTGCAARAPRLDELYSRSAAYHDAYTNPVIVIPGILGSRLVDSESGRTAWGAWTGQYANPSKTDGLRLLALPMEMGTPLRALTDDVVPDGVLDRLRISFFGLPIELNAYANILGILGVGGFRDELLGQKGVVDYGKDHFTCFQFAYDWRRDIVENAQLLDAYIEEKRAYVRREILKRYGVDNDDIKFDIVAHSMGGLVARYYLRYGSADLPEDGSAATVTWAGAEHVDRVILVGTPNAGSAKSLDQLVAGAQLSTILPTYPPAQLGTMPASYQLMPRTRHFAVTYADAEPGEALDIYDPAVWYRNGWGLASPDQDRVLKKLLPTVSSASRRREIALDHLGKCLDRARNLNAALDRPASPPDHLRLNLFAGDARPTLARIEVDKQTGALTPAGVAPGDGTVIRTSAVMDERVGKDWTPGLPSPIDWDDVTFLFTDHLGMTKDPVFQDNVLFLLLERVPPRR